MFVDGGDWHEVHVPDREHIGAVDEVDAAGADAVDRRDVQLHHLHLHRHGPCAALQRTPVGRGGVAHAQAHRGDHRRLAQRIAARPRAVVGVDDDVHRALPVQQHLARAMPRHRTEAQALQHLAQRLRPVGGVFDELDAGQPQRVRQLGDGFTVDGQRHGRLLGFQAAWRSASRRRKCASTRAASAGRPVKSSKAPIAWPTAIVPPSTVAQPLARAARSRAVSSGK